MTGRRPASAVGTSLAATLLQGGVGFLVLFTVVHGVLAATTSGLSLAEVAELVLICGSQAAVTFLRMTALVQRVGVGLALEGSVALACSTTDFGRDSGDYSAWPFGAVTLVLLGFMLLGRFAYAVCTMAVAVAITLVWSMTTGHGVVPALELVDRHVATLFVGGCFSVGYRRTLAAAREFQAVARQQRALDLAALAQANARRAAVELVLDEAGPMLTALAEGRALTASERSELVVIEGGLRDRIRAERLLSGRLPGAVASARRRGVDVLLLDESEAPVTPAHAAAADWLAGRLDDAMTGRFVGRLRGDPGGLQASAGSGERSETTVFPA